MLATTNRINACVGKVKMFKALGVAHTPTQIMVSYGILNQAALYIC